MKKYILLYIGIILSLLASCQQEEPLVLSENNGKECTLSFKVNIPQSTTFSRNTFNNGENITIDNLYLLVFDENGILQAGYAAKQVNDGVATDFPKTGVVQETQYDYQVTVVPRPEKTIIHFIANCPIPLKTILDEMANKSESEIIQSLTTTGSKTAYWQMMELNYLGEDGSDEDTVVDNLPLVQLIRNFAAVQVVDGTTSENFLQAYDLVNVPQSGTVAPYFGNAREGFADYLQTPTGTNTLYDELETNGYYGVEPAKNTYAPLIDDLPADITNTNELYLYERNHQGVDAMDITFLIVKGRYEGSSYYYRVDFAQNFEYLNILRNFRYVITIKSVTGKGYTSPELAAKGNSVNNIDVAIEVEEITDGTHTLFVSPTAKTVLNGTGTITINYSTDEEHVTCIAEIATETSGAFSSVSPSTKGSDNKGTITVDMKYYPDGVPNGKQNQTFKVKTPSGLYREVKITLIDGFEFENVTFTRNAETGNYEYSFTIPAGLEKSMFPLELFLFEESCSFSPLGDAMSVKLVDILDENGQKTGRQNWGYSATLDWEDYNATDGSTYTYQFVANSPITTDKTMTVSNEFAKQDGTATLEVPTIITIEGSDIVDNTITWYEGEETAKSINVSVTPADVTITSISITGDFTFDEETMTITPNSETPTEGTLTVTASDGTNKTLDLKVLSRPLDMNVEFGNGTQYYGIGKTFTLTFTTNKTGKYKVTNANFKLNSAESPFEFDATANTPIEVETCETTTWSDVASITIEYLGDDAGGTNPKTWTGSKRNIYVMDSESITLSGLENVNNTRTISIYKNISNTDWNGITYTTFSNRLSETTKGEVTTGKFNLSGENLTEDTPIYFVYSRNGTHKYAVCTIKDFANGNITLTFEDYTPGW